MDQNYKDCTTLTPEMKWKSVRKYYGYYYLGENKDNQGRAVNCKGIYIES